MDNFWEGIAGIGIIVLWIRAYISVLRVERNTKAIADYFKLKEQEDQRQRDIRNFAAAAGMVQK